MNFRYGRLPNGHAVRPVVPLDLLAAPGLRIPALVDSGALGIRLDADLAPAIGLDLSTQTPKAITVGGHANLLAYDAPAVRLGIGQSAWTAPVTFVSPWPYPHAVLGTDGFFDSWTVRFDRRRNRFSLKR